MTSYRKIALILLWTLPLLALALWWMTFPASSVRHNMKPWLVYGGQVAGVTGFTFFALSLLLTTRIKKLEDWLGGLDRIYHLHHTFGRIAFALLLLHPLLLGLRWLPKDTEKVWTYLLPMHNRLEVNLGSWAWWICLALLVFTLFIKIPYDKWKISHKLLGIAFGLSIAHIFLFEQLVEKNVPLFIFLALLSAISLAAYLYRTVFFSLFVKKYRYRVTRVHRLNDQVVEVNLAPEESKVPFVPGQFCFFRFHASGISREAHPYTICSAPEEDVLTINVKALGRYTRRLNDRLKEGATAFLEGPYGRFDFTHYSHPQVWIAGGVGIAPFVSWAKALKQKPPREPVQIDLYYCTNTKTEVIHQPLFEHLSEQLPGFQFHLVCADTEGFLDVSQIPEANEKNIFICGPKPMRQNLLAGFRKMGIAKGKVHYESFDF